MRLSMPKEWGEGGGVVVVVVVVEVLDGRYSSRLDDWRRTREGSRTAASYVCLSKTPNKLQRKRIF
jgi:hypothetical protein